MNVLNPIFSSLLYATPRFKLELHLFLSKEHLGPLYQF